jgi:hypothetical protein
MMNMIIYELNQYKDKNILIYYYVYIRSRF